MPLAYDGDPGSCMKIVRKHYGQPIADRGDG